MWGNFGNLVFQRPQEFLNISSFETFSIFRKNSSPVQAEKIFLQFPSSLFLHIRYLSLSAVGNTEPVLKDFTRSTQFDVACISCSPRSYVWLGDIHLPEGRKVIFLPVLFYGNNLIFTKRADSHLSEQAVGWCETDGMEQKG